MHFADPPYDENLTDLRTLISLEKKITKNKATDDHKSQSKNCKETISKRLTEGDGKDKKLMK